MIRLSNVFSGTRCLAAAFLVFASVQTQAIADVRLNGAGATFPFPIYSKWFDEYHKKNPEVRINYQSIGSGGGIKQFTDKVVDFGATDGPMTDSEISRVGGKMVHIPTVLGGVVPAFNVAGIQTLNFSGPVLADIFLGKITRWDDPALAELNPGVTLPREMITVVHRADGSGTTYCFTDYLCKVSPAWKSRVGVGVSVNWPLGIGGKGNEGVSGMVTQLANSLGYVELVYAKQNDITYGAVKNQNGKFIKADIDSITAAAASVKMPVDFRVSITNAPGDNSYPISTYTWLLLNAQNANGKGTVLKDFLTWMLKDGQAYAPKLDYAPLPQDVVAMIRQVLGSIQ